MDIFLKKNIYDIYELPLDSAEWQNYMKRIEEFKMCGVIPNGREREFDSYNRLINNVCDYITKYIPDRNILVVCGFLTALMYKNNSWLIGNQDFIYIEGDLSTEVYSKYGAEVVRGKGCCRHTSSFIYDVLSKLGYKVYKITSSFFRSYNESVDFYNSINGEDSRMPIVNKEYDEVCDNDHMLLLFKMDGKYYTYDSTHGLIGFVDNLKSIDFYERYGYLLGIQSLLKYNDMFPLEYKELINKLYNSSIKHEYREIEEEEYLYKGASYVSEVDRKTIDDYLKVRNQFLNDYRLKDEYLQNDLIRKLYKNI